MQLKSIIEETENNFISNNELKGANLAIEIGFIYRYFIIKNLGIGASLNLPFTTIGKFKDKYGNITELPKDQRESLTRLDLNLGITAFF